MGTVILNLISMGSGTQLNYRVEESYEAFQLYWSGPKKRSTITVVNYHLPTKNHCYYTPIQRPSDRERSYIICGDIAQNPDQIWHAYRN